MASAALIGHNAGMLSAIRHSLSVAALLIAATLAAPAHAWNALGHKVIAEIAWQELDPQQRQDIIDTLRRHPRFAEDFQQKSGPRFLILITDQAII